MKFKANRALRSGDFGLSPATDAQEATGNGHSGICGKAYAVQL